MVSPPNCISEFVDKVTANIHSHDCIAPLGCHYQSFQGLWEITIFASKTEIVGGYQDGLLCNSAFHADVKGIQQIFSRVTSISWQNQSMGSNDEVGAHLSLEGVYANKAIWLRITSTAPERFGVGRRADVNQKEIEEIW